MIKITMVRAGNQSAYIHKFISEQVVGIGWSELGPIMNGTSKNEIAGRFSALHPSASTAKVRVAVQQIDYFINKIAIDDTVLTYDRSKRLYYIGLVETDAIWNPEVISSVSHIRFVKWLRTVSRDAIVSKNIGSLGAFLTVFELNPTVTEEILKCAIPI